MSETTGKMQGFVDFYRINKRKKQPCTGGESRCGKDNLALYAGETMWDWLKSPKASVETKPELNQQPVEPEHKEASTNKVIVITGTSGSGRKSTAKQLSAKLEIPYVFPYTTRDIRPNERNGEHYHFISAHEFQEMDQKHAFFQSVHLERGSYGILETDLAQAFEQHHAAIVVVNHEGAQAFRKRFGSKAIRIFIYVTKDDIRLRLEREETPSEVLEEYLQNYTEQVIYKRESEYLLQNMGAAQTVEKIIDFLQNHQWNIQRAAP